MCQELQVDENWDTGASSDYASSFYESDTTSLLSAVKGHTYENGRRYHGWRQGRYAIPNDEQEQSRMDIWHHCLTLALGGELYISPIKDVHKALDLGTGTGIWAIDFADMHPSAEVIGNDLSPIQPDWVPPNVRFEIDDIEDEWTYAPSSFDFIHGRGLAGVIRDWEKIVQQSFTALKPGGWIEFNNIINPFVADDGSLPEGHVLSRWTKLWSEAAAKAGIPWLDVVANGKLQKTMKDAGFVEVHERFIKVPGTPWPADPNLKQVGQYALLHFLDGMESLTVGVFTRMLGWSMDQVKAYLDEVRAAFLDRSIHPYSQLYITYGRKPLAE